jgi:hypothetical protein
MKRVSPGTLLVPALLALVLALGAQWWASRAHPRGNLLVFVNASGASVDSLVVGAEPPYSSPLSGRAGYVAANDSAKIALPNAAGDATVRVYRGGRVLSDDVVYFGGDSEFELWLREARSVGRYRRSGAVSGSGSGAREGSGAGAGADSSRRSGT